MAKTTVGERLKQLREHLKLNHHEFAAKANTTVSTIYRIENGDTTPRQSRLREICKIFGMEEDWLIHGKGELTISAVDEKETIKDAIIKELRERIAFLEGLVKQQVKK